MIQIRYFARIREQLATDAEQIQINGLMDIEAVIDKLLQRGGVWDEVFTHDQTFLVAVNQEIVDKRTPIKDGDEIAFFPPVTGG